MLNRPTLGAAPLIVAVARGMAVVLSVAAIAFNVPVPAVKAGASLPNWALQSPALAPGPRAWAAMDYDSRRGRTVLFGGYNGTADLGDTWEWNGSAWSESVTAPSPPPANGTGMAYDVARGVSVLFDSSVTWEWDGARWTLRPTASAPPSRYLTAMAYDSARSQVVLFGGQGKLGMLGDTWVYNGTNWKKMSPATSPSPRYGMAMAFDSARGVLVLFGGRAADGQRVNDTWEWNGTNWTQRNPATVPLARYSQSMAYDTQLERVVMFGGDRFEPYFGLGPINDTWLWDGVNWVRDWTAGAPGPRTGQSMAYDSGTGNSVLFGGTDGLIPGVWSSETWELGQGIATPPGSPAVAFGSTNVAFLSQALGVPTAPASVVVTSSGTGPLLINSITTTGDFAVSGSNCPVAPDALAVGSYCRVQVTFTASACGLRTANLTFADNSAGGTDSVNLQGGELTSTCDGDLQVLPPNDITANASSPSGAKVSFQAARAVDEDNPPPAATCDHASGSIFPIGITVVTCQATDPDDATGTATATFRVTVDDTDLALAGVPADITASPSSPSGAVVTYTAPTASDEDGSTPPVDCSPASGSTFPIGVTTVTCQASDSDDVPSTVTARFRVRVGDADLALKNVPADIYDRFGTSRGAIPYYADPTPVDEDGTPPAFSCDHYAGSVFPVGVTTVTCQATDSDDTPSTVTATFHVTVSDSDLALTGIPADINVNARAGSSGATVTFTPPVATDDSISAPAVTCFPASGSTFPIGTTNVTCWTTDPDDTPNTLTAVFSVTVNDTDLTLVNVPADITVVATAPSGATVTYAPPTAVDEDPDPVPVTCDRPSGSTFPIGAWTVECQAIDSDDLGSAIAFFHVFVIPDVQLTVSVDPTAASAHTTVVSTASMTNLGTASERVTVAYSLLFTDSSYQTSTVATDKANATIAPGATASRSFSFAVKNSTRAGYYTVVVTASDSIGSVTQYGNFTVT